MADHTPVTEGPPWMAEQRALMDACIRLGVAFFWHDQELLIANRGIEAVLNAVIAEGYEVLGLDGFDLSVGYVRPRLDLMYDRDRADERWGDPISAARAFGPNVWFDVTLDVKSRPSDIR